MSPPEKSSQARDPGGAASRGAPTGEGPGRELQDRRSVLVVSDQRDPRARKPAGTWRSREPVVSALVTLLRGRGCTCDCLALWTDDFPPVIPRQRWSVIRVAVTRGDTVLALGRRVSAELSRAGFPHVRLPHPSARGKSWGSARYLQAARERVPWLRESRELPAGDPGEGSPDPSPPGAARPLTGEIAGGTS